MSQRFSAAADPLPSSGGKGSEVREWLSLLLPPLAIMGTLAGFWLIWQAALTTPTLAPISPMQSAADFSVSPVSFTSSVSPDPLRVIVLTPIPTSSPEPILWQTATSEARLTATATWKPQACPATQAEINALPTGTLCFQPTETPIPAPTSSPILGCDPGHWLPGEICQTGAPFAPTPTVTASTPVAIETSGAAKGT